MRLKTIRITNFRSIIDTGVFTVGDMTCLIGQNESGKSAILQAMECLNPAYGERQYSKSVDYPKHNLAQYERKHDKDNAKVVETTWQLSPSEKREISDKVGAEVLNSDMVTVSKHYHEPHCRWFFDAEEKNAIKSLAGQFKLDAVDKNLISGCKSFIDIANVLRERQKPSNKQKKLYAYVQQHDNSLTNVIQRHLSLPKFFYFSHYDRMNGRIAVDAIDENDRLDSGNSIFLDFMKFSGTSIEELKNVDYHEHLKAILENASNNITDQIFEYWSQNKNLAVEIDVHTARPNDTPPYNSGTIIEARVKNIAHRVTIPFSERSAGFVWFFSFITRFSCLISEASNIFILLDEPGLTLHAKAQADLLRYIEEKLKPRHQLMYSTHSPFLIRTSQLDSVRMVEDRHDGDKGTLVLDNVFAVDKDTMFPLRGAMGYEMAKSLFTAEHTLIVSNPLDVFYLQAVSDFCKEQGKPALDAQWSLCPAGAMARMSSFLSMFAENDVSLAVLIDSASGNTGSFAALQNAQVIEQDRILTFSYFCKRQEATMEDMFSPEVWCNLVNQCYDLTEENKRLQTDQLKKSKSNNLKYTQDHFLSILSLQDFDRLKPAVWLAGNKQLLMDVGVKSLGRFEEFFIKVNGFLQPK